MTLTIRYTVLCCILLYIATTVVSANLPREVQRKMLTYGTNARYGPHVLSYSPRPGRSATTEFMSSPRALEDYLLPTNVWPLNYDIHLIPYLENPPDRNFTFDGEETIRVRVYQPTSSIVMHGWDMTIDLVHVFRVRDGAMMNITNVTLPQDDNRQFLTITLEQTLDAGQDYDIHILFTGILNSQGYGFFRSLYYDENNNPRYLSATQFQATAARRAFPCFDQPDMKATFTIHIAQEPNFVAISNMPLSSQGDPVNGLPGWTWAHFQTSVPMSSYLVAFSSSEFQYVASGYHRIWSRPAVYQTGDYALQLSPQLVAAMETITGHPYTLPKMDQIGMPDFFSGAMENWGMLAYQEQYLLYDPREDDASMKQLVTQIIGHEIAHQWFGDLVTLEWWSNTWLNEGFATYYEYFSNAVVNPDWQLEEQFLVDQMYVAFLVDAGDSHPLYVPDVDNPSNIAIMFGIITYQKGGCIVRFMVNFMGKSNFERGINEYLTGNAFGAVNQYDLFNYLTPHAPPNMPVTFTEMMNTWTLQAGYPLITVWRNYTDQTAIITQERYGFNGTEQWIVPLTMTRGDSPDFMSQQAKAWLLPGTELTLISNLVPGPNDWFILNTQQIGYYRVNYDPTNWRLLSDAMSLNASIFHELNRAQLMEDARVFARSAKLDYDTALHTTNYLAQETRLTPWKVATDALDYIRDRMYQDIPRVQLFHSYMQQRITTVYNSVNGFNQLPADPLGMILTRDLITRWACNSRLGQCNNDGNTVYNVWRNSANPDVDNPIPLELRTPSYCAGQRANGLDARTFLLERYAAANTTDERNRLLSGMGCTDDYNLILSYLDLSLTPTILPGDAINVLIAVYSHPEGLDMAYDFLLLHWRELDPLYGDIGIGFVSISDKLNTQTHYDRMVQFKTDNEAELTPTSTQLINSAIRTVEDILAWNAANLDTVTNYFNNA